MSRAPRSGSPWLLRRAPRTILLLGLTACALVGALTSPPFVVLLVAPAFGLVISGVAAAFVLGFQEPAVDRRAIVLSGAWAALMVPACVGMVAFAAAGAVVMFVLMAIGSVVGVRWITETCDPFEGGSAPGMDDAAGMDEGELRLFLGALPTSLLLREWRRSGERLRPGKDAQQRLVAIRLRALLLEELSRRDPAGVQLWLNGGGNDAPDHYVRDDSSASP